MRLIIAGGPPSVGKTALLIRTIGHLQARALRCGVVKLDCLVVDEHERYRERGIDVEVGLSTYVCPDHYLASNLERIASHGLERRYDYLFIESAGLCNRCSPHLRATLAITVLSMLSGMHAAAKTGPMLRAADVLALTHGDLISQAEREVYRMRVAQMNPNGRIVEVNGLTGQNTSVLARLCETAPEFDTATPLHLRFPMPGAVCSFCLGEKRAGETYAAGNVKQIELGGGA